jgi:hypothetical protein
VSDVITLVGGTNPRAKRDCKSMLITDEEVIDDAPDAIVLSWCGVKPGKVRPDILIAVVSERTVVISLARRRTSRRNSICGKYS